jgi:hypothetical protein
MLAGLWCKGSVMQTASVTFPVSPEVGRGEPGKFRQVEVAESIKGVLGVQVEACGGNLQNLISSHGDLAHGNLEMNGFLRSIHGAFADHHPLVLSPDDVWITLVQGFANHVNANAEQLRSKFVKHEGQAKIEVIRDAFVKGSSDNNWQGVFAEFSEKIAGHIGDQKRKMIVADFSTTGIVEKAASEVVLMDTLKAYFAYVVRTRCGIPEVTLLGNQDDWQLIKERVQMFAEFGAADWVRAVSSVLDRFVEAHRGNADPKFWKSLYKEDDGSGGPYVTGAVNVFFPYLSDRKTKTNSRLNETALAWEKGFASRFGGGPHTSDFPQGLSAAPFTWHYYGQTYNMSFLGGFVGTSQDPTTGALRPALGWGIADRATAN